MAENETPHVDPHHRLPDDQWGAVVRRANEVRAEHEAAAAAQEGA